MIGHLVAVNLPGLPQQDVVERAADLGQGRPVHVGYREHQAHPLQRGGQRSGHTGPDAGIVHLRGDDADAQRLRRGHGRPAGDRREHPGHNRHVGAEQADVVE
jgi:hypothetical protein